MKKRLGLTIIFIGTLVLLTRNLTIVHAQTTDDPLIGINNPLPGQAVQGLVQIDGFINIDNFQSFSLEFSFSGQEFWFPIISNSTEIPRQRLGEWDTSTITDGNYDLRLSVLSAEGEETESISSGIRVRNYSNIETNTPQPTPLESDLSVEATVTLAPTITPLPDLSPTPLPDNQASFSRLDIQEALIRGGILGIILFGLLTIIFQRKNHN